MPNAPPEDPTLEMIERGRRVALATGHVLSDVVIHDIWQAMYDEWQAVGFSAPGSFVAARALYDDFRAEVVEECVAVVLRLSQARRRGSYLDIVAELRALVLAEEEGDV